MIQVTKVWWDGEKLMAEPIDPAAIYKEPEQPTQQEPVGFVRNDGEAYWTHDKPAAGTNLYTSPPARQQEPSDLDVWKARALQAEAVVAKFMAPQPVQRKPFAWANTDDLSADTAFRWCEIGNHKTPLYTSPPANANAGKPWVGLTDEDIEKGRDQTFSINNPYCPCDSKTMRKAVRWAEAKLRERNATAQRKPLTDAELGQIINANWGVGVWQMARAIEAAHGIKENT